MPFQTTWHTWPVVLLHDDVKAYMESPGFLESSIVARDPSMLNGVCFGVCALWFHRNFVEPDETPLDRMNRLNGDLDNAAAIQFAMSENFAALQNQKAMSALADGEHLTSAARDLQLKFKSYFEFWDPSGAGTIPWFLAKLRGGRQYYLAFTGDRVEPSGSFFQSLQSALGCFGGPTGQISDFNHAAALAYGDTGTSKLFDVNYGEFEIGQHELERFWRRYMKDYERRGYAMVFVRVYEVGTTESIAAVN